MVTQFRFKCVSTHKATDGKNTFFDARLLAASASEQPAGAFVGDKPAGKLDLQRLAAQPFQQDTEYIVTIEAVPAPVSPTTPAPSTVAPPAAPAPTPTAKPAAQTPPPAGQTAKAAGQ